MDKNKVITTEQISTMMKHFPTDALKKNALDTMVSQGFKIQGYNDTSGGADTTPKKPDAVGDYISSQGSFKEQKAKVESGDAGVIGSAFSGAPLAPATKTDVNANAPGFNPLKIIGKTLANTASDLPSIVKGAADMVIHPIDAVKGIAQYYSGIATETFGALKDAAMKGDTTRLLEDIQKATVQMIDHPLQTIAAFEGAKGIVEGGASFVKNPVKTATGVAEKVTSALDAGKLRFEAVKQGMKDKGVNFETDATLHKKTIEVADTLGNMVEKQKMVTDLQKELDSMKKPVSENLKGKEQEISAKTAEQTQKELELQRAKSELKDLGKIQKQQVKEASDSAKNDFGSKGFSSLKDMQTNLKDFFTSVKEKLGTVYEENLGDTPIKLDKFFEAVKQTEYYLKGISDNKTFKAIQPIVDNLKMRDFVTKYANDEKGFFNAMAKNGIEPKFNSLAEYTKEYPPLTSKNFKGTRNVIRETIKENNRDALKNYDKNITPALRDAFRESITSQYGDAALTKLDQADKAWSELASNPISKIQDPTLTEIQQNWESFVKNTEQLPEGKVIMEKIQNYVGEQILKKAEQANETYSVSSLNTSLKKYGDMLGADIKGKIDGVINLNNSLSKGIETVKTSLETQKGEVGSIKEQVAKLQEEQKQIKATAKGIGDNPNAIITNIKKIKSTTELNDFLKNTGKSIEDVRKVVTQAIIEKADPRLLEDKNVPFDVNKTGEIIKELKDIGKSEDGIEYKKVNNEILGEKGVQALKDLETKFKEYNSLKEITKKSSGAMRIMKGAFGTFLLAIGHTFWGGLEIARALSGGETAKEDISGRERPAPVIPKSSSDKTPIVKKIIKGGGINQASKQDN